MFWQADPTNRSPERPWRTRLRRAVDLAVAFATLEEAPSPPGHPDAPEPHPHHRTLRAPARAGRPGTVAARVTPCTTPLAPSAAGRRGRTRGRSDDRHLGRA
jgi:hypothetical protein